MVIETPPLVSWGSLVFGWLLAYLTITGGKLVGTNTDETHALNALRLVAERQKLAAKLNQFTVTWNETVFEIEDRPELPALPDRIDLFSPAGQS